MTEPAITIFGAHWCPDCRRSRQFLGEHQIPYRWVDIEEDATAEAFVLTANRGKRIVPTIVFADRSLLPAPSNAALADKLGLRMKAERSHYDLVVAGGGVSSLLEAEGAKAAGAGAQLTAYFCVSRARMILRGLFNEQKTEAKTSDESGGSLLLWQES